MHPAVLGFDSTRKLILVDSKKSASGVGVGKGVLAGKGKGSERLDRASEGNITRNRPSKGRKDV